MTEIKLGRVAGLNLSAAPSAIVGSLLLWLLLSGIGVFLLRFGIGEAIAGGLVALLMHWASELVHQLGHAWAARSTGYPMTGVRLWGVLSSSVYPADEPALPAAIHIRRALGGPVASLLMTLFALVVALALRPLGDIPWWIGVYFALDNLFVFTLGSLLPLGFTDGSTLLRWWGRP
jgi:hypothetical protein